MSDDSKTQFGLYLPRHRLDEYRRMAARKMLEEGLKVSVNDLIQADMEEGRRQRLEREGRR
jgi:hypothetical protein